jgi:hypothetical protein
VFFLILPSIQSFLYTVETGLPYGWADVDYHGRPHILQPSIRLYIYIVHRSPRWHGRAANADFKFQHRNLSVIDGLRSASGDRPHSAQSALALPNTVWWLTTAMHQQHQCYYYYYFMIISITKPNHFQLFMYLLFHTYALIFFYWEMRIIVIVIRSCYLTTVIVAYITRVRTWITPKTS